MSQIKPHRNSQKRFYGADKIYFITTVTHKRFSFFKEDLFCNLFIDNLRICKKLKEFKLYAFIMISDHVHLLLKPNGEFNVSQIMFSIKKQFSHDVNRVIGENKLYSKIDANKDKKKDKFFEYGNENEHKYPEGEQTFVRLQDICVRFQDGNNVRKDLINRYQKNVEKYRKQFITKYGNPQFEMPKFKWQKSFYDHVIRNEKDFLKHLNYIVFNCVKHRVCYNEEEYKWSSLNSDFEDFIDDWQ
ncbi:transposase [Candidatus Parcubacteria bacterium]|nr:transposase [Candidatus Parcubacteria bacterium]